MFVFKKFPEVQVVERIQVSQTTLNTSSTSTSSGVPAATHAATALATTDDDSTPPILDDEQMLFRYQAQIDQCVHMLKTKEDLERYEEQTAAILERAPRAASRNRCEWQKVVDEDNALILHHRQVVQTTKEKLASLMREMQEKRHMLLHRTLRRLRGKTRHKH